MSTPFSLAVVSDIHFAGEAEQARGHPRAGLTTNPLLNAAMQVWDHFFWMRDPFAHNSLLEVFLREVGETSLVVANGDFACDAACVGVSDPAALASAEECLSRLRSRFGSTLLPVVGDHELGKKSFVGGVGGMRLASWLLTVERLKISPLWRREVGCYVLIGMSSSLAGLDILRPDILSSEWPEWERLRAAHLQALDAIFDSLLPGQRVVLFCHDPSALPFLAERSSVRSRFGQIDATIVGHLHSEVVFRTACRLAGMPSVNCLGSTLRRWSRGLQRAGHWRPFNVILCPSLAGLEWDRRGGWLLLEMDPEGREPLRLRRRPLIRE